MTRQRRLIDISTDLVRQADLPPFLNVYGRKWHSTTQIILCCLVRATFRLSWRRAARFMNEFYSVGMDYSCWHKAAAKLPLDLLHRCQSASVGALPAAWAAVDGTTFTRANPSQHYLRRIDRDGVTSRPVQAVVMIDVARRKFLSWRIRARPRGEKCDVPYLLRHAPARPEGVLFDKNFDAEWIHQLLDDKNIWSIAPTRKGCRRGRHRKILRDCFDYCLYWQRSIVECLFSALKRLFGVHISARHWHNQTQELSWRMIAYNTGAQQTTICNRAYTMAKKKLFDHLRKLGITLRLKEMNFNRPRVSQKGVDINLTADMISLAYEDAYDIAVLLSGDGDYVSLVDLVKSKGKRVIILSFRSCLAAALRECADKVMYFENLPELSRRKTQNI